MRPKASRFGVVAFFHEKLQENGDQNRNDQNDEIIEANYHTTGDEEPSGVVCHVIMKQESQKARDDNQCCKNPCYDRRELFLRLLRFNIFHAMSLLL